MRYGLINIKPHMKKINRKISAKIEKDMMVIEENVININKAKIPNILILNLGLDGYTFILH